MNRLTWTVVALVLGAAFVPDALQAQTPPNPNRNALATSFINPWANPILSQYQRQREVREKRELDRSIQQLQRLEVLRMGRTAGQATTTGPVDDTPTPSVRFKKPTLPTSTATAPTAAPKKKPVKPGGDATAEDAAKTDKAKADEAREMFKSLKPLERSGGPSRSFSNYGSLLKKQ